MKAAFVELPAFERFRTAYLDDEAFAALQQTLMKEPEAFWLYALYGKDEMSDLTPKQRKALKTMLKAELESRRAA